MKKRGSVLVLFLLWALVFWSVVALTMDIGQWVSTEQRLQSIADAALLSSLRVRVDGLQTIAARWRDVGRFMVEGYPHQEVLVPGVYWNAIQKDAENLRRAIGGYRGRIAAVFTVALEAHGVSTEGVRSSKNEAQILGVSDAPVTMRDETGHLKLLRGGWYQRDWLRSEAAPDVIGISEVQFHWAAPLGGAAGRSVAYLWEPTVKARGRLRWDVDPTDGDVHHRGNGGFPGSWSQVLEGGEVQPHRFPVYRAELTLQRATP